MGTYIFLANTLGGVSGGPIYVRNKARFLKTKGWNVIAYDNTQVWNKPIVERELAQFSKNRYSEMLFPPSWFPSSKKDIIIKRIIDTIPYAEDNVYVVESLQIVLSLWGEIIAKQLNAKHIIFDINENDVVKNESIFEYLYFKYERQELFCISEKAMVNLFSNFKVINNPGQHYWSAGVFNDVVEDHAIDSLITKADFTVGYFGRWKRFVPYVNMELATFCKRHPTVRINYVLLGITNDQFSICNFEKPSNLNVICLGVNSPLPSAFFNRANVVVASAGCAAIAYRQGAKVISMQVDADDKPLGFLGCTTNATSYSFGFIHENRSLLELLEDSYNGNTIDTGILDCQHLFINPKDYDFQLGFINGTKDYYNTNIIKFITTGKQKLQKCLVGIGMSNIAYRIKQFNYYCKYRNNNI
jgi:hypothetical protein